MAGAQVKVSALTEDSSPTADDLLLFVHSPGGTPGTRKTAYENFIKAYYSPDGVMVNGKLSVTVSASDLIVALKTLAGTDASTTDPIYCRINGTVRSCTAALSITLADATNWMSLGTTLEAKETDLFAYAIWNTTPATDVFDLGIARKPFYSVYSEASATTTNENYLAYANGSAPTSTDNLVNIGRFAATLSAGAGYTWTVPTFTLVNLKNRPTFETRWLVYTPTITGYSANPSSAIYLYKIEGNKMLINWYEGAAGTSNNAAHTYTAPLAAATRAGFVWSGHMGIGENNTTAEAGGYYTIVSAASTITATRPAAAAWTASGSSRATLCTLMYELA